MNIKSLFHRYGAYLLTVLLFAAVAGIYCFPALQGKVVVASDNHNWMGAANEGLTYAEETGEHSWWSGSMFCGMPTYTVGAGGEYRSNDLLAPLGKVKDWGLHSAWWQLFLYFICFYVLMRSFGISVGLSILGALATGLSSYFLIIIPSGHNTKAVTIAFSALTLAGLRYTFSRKHLLGAILTMLSVSTCYTLHPQMFYYFYMLAGLMLAAELWIHLKGKRMKEFGVAAAVFLAATAIGVGSQSASLLATSEFTAESTRGGSSQLAADGGQAKGLDIGYATEWSYGIDETMTLLIPGFKGGSSKEGMYWGGQPFTAGNVYAGAIVCFLFILGLMVVTGPYKWMLLAATLFSVFLSWGHNFNWLTELFFKYFPLYNKFRAVSSILVVAEVTLPLLGVLALKEIFSGSLESRRIRRGILTAAGITAGLCLFFALFAKGIFDFHAPEESEAVRQLPPVIYGRLLADRASTMRGDALRSALFILTAAGLLLAGTAGRLKQWTVIALLSLLTVADLWGVDRRYFNYDNFERPAARDNAFAMTDWEREILADTDLGFRVLNLTGDPFNESRTSYRLKSVGGYSAVKLRLYQDLIDEHLAKGHFPVYNMLNTRYIITEEEGVNHVARNDGAMGSAWWVNNVMLVDNPRDESDALMVADLTTTAVVDKSFLSKIPDMEPGRASYARVSLTDYTPRSLDYITSSPADGLVVFSEIYYPHGWKATIDGRSASIIRANYALRALVVPSGIHNIHFEFDPDSVRRGDSAAIAFIILMYLITLGAVALSVVKAIKRKHA